MIRVRTVRKSDLAGVLALAEQAFPGMTTLQPDKDFLQAKINASIRSTQKTVTTADDESYFLILEDLQKKEIIGTASIIACLGCKDEFYSYKLNKITQSCKSLAKKISFETLNLSNHYEGFSEVASLYLHKDYRKNGNGKLLAKSRYLFMAQFRQRFGQSVMSDLRGYFDENGQSPFWNAVGRHFFDMEFVEADLYGALNGNQFISDLMPRHPIYVNMLPAAAQQVIGQPNSKGKPALNMLLQEGFCWNGYVDIFDGAPSVESNINDVGSVKNSARAMVATGNGQYPIAALVCNTNDHDFKACQTPIAIADDTIQLPDNAMAALELKAGDMVRFLPIGDK